MLYPGRNFTLTNVQSLNKCLFSLRPGIYSNTIKSEKEPHRAFRAGKPPCCSRLALVLRNGTDVAGWRRIQSITNSIWKVPHARRSPCFDWRRIQSHERPGISFLLTRVAVLVLIGEGFKELF